MIGKVCIVSREMEGVAGAGGLKDVVRGLASALTEAGADVTVVIPAYGFVAAGVRLAEFSVTVNGRAVDVAASVLRIEGIRVVLLDAEAFRWKKAVYTYTADDAPEPELVGKGHRDVHEMNVILQAGAVRFLLGDGPPPDVVHGHDGHTGLLPLYMKKHSGPGEFFERTGILVTIHNAGEAYQQILGDLENAVALTGLPAEDLALGLIDGKINPLLVAGRLATVNTVSPGYAREMLSRGDGHAGGLGAAYRAYGVHVKGVINGIDPGMWGLPRERIGRGRPDKAALRRDFAGLIREGLPSGLEFIGAPPNPDTPWVLFHNRLTDQKGLEELIGLPEELRAPASYAMIVYGQGDPEWESALSSRCAGSAHWTFLKGYDPDLTHRLFSAASFVVVPSLWEPCGQIDMIGQLHGALPVVRRVGGLRKVRRFIDGFSYSPRSKSGLRRALETALILESEAKTWVRMMRRFAENVVYERRSWRKILVRGYVPLYRKATRRTRTG